MRHLLRSCGLAAMLAASGLSASPDLSIAQETTPAVSLQQAEQRADALLARMTLEEKVGQVTQYFMFGDPASFEAKIKAGAGSMLFVTDPAVINRLQKVAVGETRLGIPMLFAFDVVHGLRTIFPVPIGMAASWDPEIVEAGQAVAAAEARASGIHWTFAPMLDITRDPRWGRIVEGPGEDPFLASALARAQVRGFQGPELGTPGRILSGPKHFAVYGASEGGRDYDAVNVSDSQFYNVYLPPFAAAIEAGAGNIMSAYMELNDVPAAGNHWLLTDVLRGELGFQGFVVSDANGIKSLVPQAFAVDDANAAMRGMNAGNDMEMAIGDAAYANLVQVVRDGRVEQATLDASVRRILIAKYRLGLFEDPFVDETRSEAVLNAPEHRAVARRAAERSLVLMKNDGGALPLRADAGQSIAVIGPLADAKDDILGSWVFAHDPTEAVTIFEGIRDKLGSSAHVETAPGVQIQRNVPSMFEMIPQLAALRPRPAPWSEVEAEQAFQDAVTLARRSDVVVMALGETQLMSGEGASRTSLELPGGQQRLLDAVTALGKPVVLVLLNGRPLDIERAAEQVPAILEAWYPGTEGGRAIADALFGDVNPGGKLPMTWPRDAGQIPIYYSHAVTKAPDDQGSRYWDEPSTPLYPFGHGLSYTTFAFSDLKVDAPAVPVGQSVTVSATVTNTGERAGDEVAQLYIHQRSGRSARPIRELKGFRRVTLAPGESRTLTFTLGEADLRYWSAAERKWVVDPAMFDVWVGSDSTAPLQTSFEVVP